MRSRTPRACAPVSGSCRTVPLFSKRRLTLLPLQRTTFQNFRASSLLTASSAWPSMSGEVIEYWITGIKNAVLQGTHNTEGALLASYVGQFDRESRRASVS